MEKIRERSTLRSPAILGANEERYYCILKVNLESKLDAYWLKEDITETFPDVICEFTDDAFQYLKISSRYPLRFTELYTVFNHYKMDFKVVIPKRNRRNSFLRNRCMTP